MVPTFLPIHRSRIGKLFSIRVCSTQLYGHNAIVLPQIAAKDKEAADAISDIRKLIDAHAFLRNPKQFTAQYVSDYMINRAFGELSRQFAASEAEFVSTYPDVD